MLKMTEFPCPTPGCGKVLQVKMTKRGRPSVTCKLNEGGCGWTGFVNAKRGVQLWTEGGEAVPAKQPKSFAPISPERDSSAILPIEKSMKKDFWDW